jgi:hypothetical protein
MPAGMTIMTVHAPAALCPTALKHLQHQFAPARLPKRSALCRAMALAIDAQIQRSTQLWPELIEAMDCSALSAYRGMFALRSQDAEGLATWLAASPRAAEVAEAAAQAMAVMAVAVTSSSGAGQDGGGGGG